MNQPAPKKVAIQTIGCRLNQYESERMVAQLAPFGFERVMPNEQADLYIINTCTVTHRADSSCRNLIRRAIKNNPDSRVVVVGCYVDAEPETIAGMEGVDLIVGNEHKDDIGRILPMKLPELFEDRAAPTLSTTIGDFFEHNRAWIKVSDGCNQSCSFCIVTKVRGPQRNRPAGEIIDEINRLVESGYNEVVLTGVNIGHYKYNKSTPQVKNLAALCRLILSETDLGRIRISSIEPQTIRDDLLSAYAEADGRICRHFHIPMQSGSERILKLMRRPYTPEKYLERLKAVKDVSPHTTIGADIIVGFPGETEEDFRMTEDIVQSGLIDYLHVFSYSDRKGTGAATMPDKVNPEIIKERNTLLSEISDRLLEKAHNRQVGRVLDVISEHKPNEYGGFWGISGNYVRVKLPGGKNPGKDIIRVKVRSANAHHVDGDVLS